jgi:hypothetical protein
MSLPMPNAVPEPGYYYHYKHDPAKGYMDYAYEVLGVGFHTEDDVQGRDTHFIIYRPLDQSGVYNISKDIHTPCFYARPLEMWMESVEYKGQTVPRFSKITDPEVLAQLETKRAEMYGV